jgi:hypothetical protein
MLYSTYLINIKVVLLSSRSHGQTVTLLARFLNWPSLMMTTAFLKQAVLSCHSFQFPDTLFIELSSDQLHFILVLDLLLQPQKPPLLCRTQLPEPFILLLQCLFLRLGRVASAFLGENCHWLGQESRGVGLTRLAYSGRVHANADLVDRQHASETLVGGLQ